MTATRYRAENPDLFAPSPAPPPGRGAGAASDVAAVKQSHVRVAGLDLLADPSGALLIEDDRILIVADLHLEKGSSFAMRRQLLPPYDTAATLARLAVLVARTAPRRIVALGDSFHDRRAAARLGEAERDAIAALQAGRTWTWVAGNHDPLPPEGLEGDLADEVHHGPLRLRHEPQPGAQAGEVAGHLHPVALVAGQSGVVRRRSFVSDGTRCVMPAFGAYAGGLNFYHPAFAALFPTGPTRVHALGRERVYAVAAHQCLPDR